MNRLIRIMCAFVLPFLCLLVNVSYAVEFGTSPIGSSSISLTQGKANDTNFSSRTYGGYTLTQISSIINNYYNSVDIPSYETMLSSLKSANYELTLIYNEAWGNSYSYNYVLMKKGYFDFGLFYDNSRAGVYFSPLVDNFNIYEDLIYAQSTLSSNTYSVYYVGPNSSQNINNIYGQSINKLTTPDYIQSSTLSVKQLGYSNGYTWDGTSYSYIASNTDDTPSLPSNAEIAQAVQAFYNSDYYKNNKDFKEFFVLYNSANETYSFIGHNSVGEIANHFKYGSTLSQHIYSENYPSNTTGLSYWNFYLETLSSQISNIFNNYYWLYSSNDNGTSIIYNGKGYITDLIDVKFDSRYSTIIYSSVDYLCRVYDYENDEETIEDATISGDQYTYDENLDPTTNEYNPIENFVPVNPEQSILGDINFDEINKTFEENKDLLNIEGASWLFTANNKLIGYFIGFLSLLIVFLIISRILGG